MKLNGDINRLAIYLFYDKDGIIDSYIPYFLKDLKKSCSEIFFVSNGKIKTKEKEKLNGIVETIFERENKGFDVWGYKESLEKIGWKKLSTFDEVILCNYTIMGPVYPFSEMFETMNKCNLDFWGITRWPKVENVSKEKFPDGYINEHIQSHFIVVRNKMLTSKEFRKYWNEMPMVNSYDDSINLHESKFTNYFAKLGYKWDVYVNCKDLDKFNMNQLLYNPVSLIKNKKCPIFKRRSFFHIYNDIISNSEGEHGIKLLNYLKQYTNYDINMIWDNILRSCDMSSIKDALQLNYILSTNITPNDISEIKNKKIALIFHAYFPDLIEDTKKYVNAMPKFADIYITTNTEEKKAFFEKEFKNNQFNKFEVILIENRGRDVSSLLVGSKNFVMDYDYVCFAHDKKTAQISVGSVGNSFANHCLENVLANEKFVLNVINTFNNNPRLGLLTPMPPIHGDFFSGLGNEWGPNFDATKQLADKLKINVPINKNHPPIAPLGTMFWFRPKGMQKLFAKNWQYKDFPKEPNKVDGTILHGIERLYGFVQQDAGYYVGWLFSDIGSSISITNLYYMLSNLNVSFQNNEIVSNFEFTNKLLDYKLSVAHHLEQAGKYFSLAYPELFKTPNAFIFKLYIDTGEGFNENNTLYATPSIKDDILTCSYIGLDKYKNIKSLRLDPGEDGFIVLSDIEISTNKRVIYIDDLQTNGILNQDSIVFATKDPMIIWKNDADIIDKLDLKCNIKFGINTEDLNINNVENKLICKLYVDIGEGFNEKNIVYGKTTIKDNKLSCKITGLNKYKNIRRFRIDPGEDGNIILSNIDLSVDDNIVKTDNIKTNGINYLDKIILNMEDPMMLWDNNQNEIKQINFNCNIKFGIDANDFVDFKDNKINNISCKIYIDTGTGFNEKNTVYGKTIIKNNLLICKFTGLSKYKNIKKVRLDPGEEAIILKNLKIHTVNISNTKTKVKKYITNGKKIITLIKFNTNDPMIIWNNTNHLDNIIIEAKIVK